MKKLSLPLFALGIAMIAILGSTTQGVLAVETPLTDYSRAVMLENPTYYWNFNEAGATDVANEVMRNETEAEMMPIIDATRTASYSTELGNAASLNGTAAFWGQMINRGHQPGAYAIEYWAKADAGAGAGYIFDPLGEAIGGNAPAIIHGFLADQTELFYYTGARTGNQAALNFDDGQWHHVVLGVNFDEDSVSVDQIDIAVDGVVMSNFTSIPSEKLNLTGAICLGACKPVSAPGVNDYATGPEAGGVWDGFSGQLDEFAIYELGGMDATAVTEKVTSLASHYALATTPTAITPFAAVDNSQISYSVIDGNEPSDSYDDDTGVMLTDGIYAGSDNTSYAQKAVGYYGDHYVCDYTVLEFDLSEAKTLDAIWIDYLGAGGRYGINAPASVELSFSTDGTNFSEPILIEEFNNTTDTAQTYFNERCLQIDLDSVDAQYIRANFGFITNFVFLSEVRFMEELDVTEQIAGDANNDGKVDGSDVTILAGNWQKGVSDGLTATWEEGDFNADGKVDGSDVTILAGNWQYGVEAAAASVPEPGTIVLLISVFASLLILRRNR